MKQNQSHVRATRRQRAESSILEPSRRVPVIGHYDVVVLGGGPAGVAAALAAARQKAKVLLVEQTGCLGGMGTAGLVPAFGPFSRTKEPFIRGIALEIRNRLQALGAVGKDPSGFGWIPIHAEGLKRVCDELVTGARITVLYLTLFSEVIRRGGKIEAAILQNKGGRQAVRADVFIDATGDADVAARAGAPFDKGDARGRMQGASLCMLVANVDIPRYWSFVDRLGDATQVAKWCRQKEAAKLLPRFRQAEYRGIHGQSVAPGILGFNFGHLYGIDGTEPRDISRAMIVGRQMANAFVEFARKHMPGMERGQLVTTASLPGIRETRRIRGRFHLTLEHCMTGTHFPDDIVWYDYPVDVHNTSRNAKSFGKFVRDFDTLTLPKGSSYGIPYRCLLPLGLDNLLVAGRALSADRFAQGSARPMPACYAIGQACGTAAALAARLGISPVKLDVHVLRRALRRAGALV